MGVHCFGALEVIHLGLPDDTESYVQETGCAGWDDSPALALMLLKPGANRYAEKSIVEYSTNSSKCRRDFLSCNFDGYIHKDMGRCLCCDVCAKSCLCGKCESNYGLFVFKGKTKCKKLIHGLANIYFSLSTNRVFHDSVHLLVWGNFGGVFDVGRKKRCWIVVTIQSLSFYDVGARWVMLGCLALMKLLQSRRKSTQSIANTFYCCFCLINT